MSAPGTGATASRARRGGAWGSSLAYTVGLVLPSALAALACLPTGGPRASSAGSALLALAFLPAAYLTAYVVLTFRGIADGIAAALVMWWLCLQAFVATFIFGLISLGLMIPFVAAICVGVIVVALHRRQMREAGESRSAPRLRTHLMLLVALLAVAHAMSRGEAAVPGVALIVALGFAPHTTVCWDELSAHGTPQISWRRVAALVALAWSIPALHRMRPYGIEALIWPIQALS